MSVQTKIVLLTIIISASIGICTSLFVCQFIRESLERELEQQAVIFVQVLSDTIIHSTINGDKLHVHDSLAKAIKRRRDIQYAYVIGFYNEIMAHTFVNGFPRGLLHKSYHLPKSAILKYFVTSKGPILEVSYPLIQGMAAHLHVGMDAEKILVREQKIRRSILTITFIVTLLGGLMGIALSSNFLNPLEKLNASIEAFRMGKITNSLKIGSYSPEIAELMRTFYRMATERKKMEEVLSESEKKYRHLIESANDAIFLIENDTGIIIEVNRKAEELLGMPIQEIVGMHQSRLYPESYDENVETQVNDGDIVHMKGIGKEILVCRKDGSKVPVEISSNIMELGGRTILQGIFRDITGRKKVEENLRKRLAYEKMLTDISSKVLYIDDMQKFQNMCLEIMGKIFDIDRAYIAKYSNKSDTFIHVGLWVSSCAPSLNQEKINIHFSLIPRWSEIIRKKEVLNVSKVDEIPDEKIRQELHAQGVKSIISMPMLIDDEYYGFIGFETCQSHCIWHDEDISVMKTFVSILTQAIKRKEMEDKLIQLEREVLDIARKEQERIALDLHDILGQKFTAIACMSKLLVRRLNGQGQEHRDLAAQITEHVNEAISLLKNVIKTLHPIPNVPDGLMLGLKDITIKIANTFNIPCEFICRQSVLIYNNAIATHLYSIALEATNNAIKHGKASHISISLTSKFDKVTMAVMSNGFHFPDNSEERKGRGLEIIHYRSRIIGARCKIRNIARGGTIVAIHLNQNRNVYRSFDEGRR